VIASAVVMRFQTISFAMFAAALTACGGSTSNDATSPPTNKGTEDGAIASENPTSEEQLEPAPFCAAPGSIGYDFIGKAIFAALTPDSPTEYLALRENVGTVPSPGLSKELQLVSERGQLCSGAGDLAKCKQAYDQISPPIRLGFHHCFTRGNTVGCVESTKDAMALIGQVDSIEEAYFVAEYGGYGVSCATSVPAQGKKLTDGSFQLALSKMTSGGPCGQLHRAVINVARDGAIREVKIELVDANPSCP
jgi:hypothetical protein